MNVLRNSKGFSALHIVLVLVVAGLIGLVGYRIYSTQKAIDGTPISNATSSIQKATASVKEITNSTDAKKVTNTLDQAKVESDLDPSALDNDVKSLL